MTAEDKTSPPFTSLTCISKAWWITGIYALAAMLWIYFSDRALGLFLESQGDVVAWSTRKGIIFVIITSTILFVSMRWIFGALEKSFTSLQNQEQEVKRLNRLYSALNEINHSIARTSQRDELFEKICRNLVEHGGFCMAWVGWNNPATHILVPVASYGDNTGYLKTIEIATNESPEGQRPAGQAFRQSRPHISNDVVKDPSMEFWREEVQEQGFKSLGAFPIRIKHIVRGMLNVYSMEKDFFQKKELDLLMNAASEISFALENFEREAERVRARESVSNERAFSETLLESLPGILYFYNKEGKFLRWNRNFAEVSGYSPEEIATMHPLDFFTLDDRNSVKIRIEETMADGESSVEAPFLTKSGRQIPYFFTGSRIQYEGEACLVGVGIDLSERAKAEHALRELNENLEHMVAERTWELQAALVRAEAADQLKSAFLATMSHELRTPLNSIIGFTGIVLQELAGPLNPEQAKQLGMVRKSSRHLLNLINDILDLSKIEAGQLEIQISPFDLGDCISNAVELVRPLAEQKSLQLSTSLAHLGCPIVSDQRRVQQILINLLNNAIKFTDHGSVSLSLEYSDEPPFDCASGIQKGVCIKVSDTGIGISTEDLAKLFQPFQQVDTGLTRQHEGTGLGLVICRRLVKLLGGEIHVRSVESSGSEFTLTLPLSTASAP